MSCAAIIVPLTRVMAATSSVVRCAPSRQVIVLRYVWRRSKENVGPEYHEPLDSIVRFFATGFLPAALVVLIVELIVSVVLVLVLYRGRLQEALGLLGAQDGAEVDGDGSGTGGYAGQPASYVTMDINLLLFLFCSAYVTAATIEEVAKVAIVRYACCPTRPCCAQHVTQRVHARTTLLYMLAGAIGFSTIENIGYTFGSVIGPTAVYDGWAIAIQALVRALVSLPVHILCAALTASRLVRRDREKRELPNPAEAKGMMWVLGPAIAVHGTFNFQAMTLAVALNGMVDEVGGGVLMLGLAILILCMASCAFLRQWETHAEPLAAGGHAAQMVTVGSGHGHGHGHVHGHGRGGRGSDAV